jgi:L-asparaginase
VDGLAVAGTGNGTVHRELEAALRRAEADGVAVRRATRCLGGAVVGAPAGALRSAGALTPVQARIELMLELIDVR